MDLSQELKEEFASWQIGKELEVLIEERQGEYMVGHASNYLKVNVDLDDTSVGKIYLVKITGQKDDELIGSVICEAN